MLKFHWLLLKVWVALIAALLLLVFIAEGLRRIGSTRLLLIVILLSCVAYFIREKRMFACPAPVSFAMADSKSRIAFMQPPSKTVAPGSDVPGRPCTLSQPEELGGACLLDANRAGGCTRQRTLGYFEQLTTGAPSS